MDKSFIAFNTTNVGYNHIKVGKVCEDNSISYFDEANGIYICAIADGHGNDNYPRADRGSRFAVESALNNSIRFEADIKVNDLLQDEKYHFDIMSRLASSILAEWYKSIETDIQESPFTKEELSKVSKKYQEIYLSNEVDNQKKAKAYGTTLILFVITSKFSYGIQIGDGRCIALKEDGTFFEPIPWDDACQFNVTTSICDENALEEFRYHVSSHGNSPIAVFCGSDGIDDSYSSLDELKEFYRSLLILFYDSEQKEQAVKEIEEYLPILSKKGSGDDVSIAGIINCYKLSKIVPKFKMQIDLAKIQKEIRQKEKEILKEKDLLLEEETNLNKLYHQNKETIIPTKDEDKLLAANKDFWIPYLNKIEDSRKRNREKGKLINKLEIELNSLKDQELEIKEKIETFKIDFQER